MAIVLFSVSLVVYKWMTVCLVIKPHMFSKWVSSYLSLYPSSFIFVYLTLFIDTSLSWHIHNNLSVFASKWCVAAISGLEMTYPLFLNFREYKTFTQSCRQLLSIQCSFFHRSMSQAILLLYPWQIFTWYIL